MLRIWAVRERRPTKAVALGGKVMLIARRGNDRPHRSMLLGIFLLGAMVQGCETVPPELLGTYTDAFSQAKLAGEALYTDYGERLLPAASAQASTSGGGGAAGSQLDFDSHVPKAESLRRVGDAPLKGPARDELTVQIRMSALAAVADYNDSLSALASGQSVDQVRQGTGRLSGALGVVGRTIGDVSFAGAVPYAAALQQVVELLLQAADREKLRLALLKVVARPAGADNPCGGDPPTSPPAPAMAHPAIIMLDLLEADSICVYRLARSVYQGKFVAATARYDEAAERFEGSTKPDDALSMSVAFADARQLLDEASTYAKAIETYRQLIGEARTALQTVMAHATTSVADLSNEEKIARAVQLHASLRAKVVMLTSHATAVRLGLPR